MTADLAIKIATALLPALIMVGVFDRLDAFKLVDLGETLRALLAGAVISLVSYIVNGRSLDGLPIGYTDYSRFIAPFVEEALKGSFIVWLLLRNRIGFVIDAALVGFTLGVGFAVFENAYYLWLVPDANFGVWLVRGVGTAIMHGGAAALFAVIGHGLIIGRARFNPLRLLPGYAAAVALHGAYNQFPNQPVVAMMGVLVATPFSLLFALARGRGSADRWIAADYESHAHLLAELKAPGNARGEAGRLLDSVRETYGANLADALLEYLTLHTELVIEAENRFLAMEAGRRWTPSQELEGWFDQLRAVERKIGRAALMALQPRLHFSRRELWELHELASDLPHHPLRARLSRWRATHAQPG